MWQYILEEGAKSNSESMPTYLILIGVLGVLFYFFMWRPSRRDRQKQQQMMDSLKRDDKVVTIGGLHGTVIAVKDNEVVLKVDDNSDVKMKFTRSAIGTIVPKDGGDADKKES